MRTIYVVAHEHNINGGCFDWFADRRIADAVYDTEKMIHNSDPEATVFLSELQVLDNDEDQDIDIQVSGNLPSLERAALRGWRGDDYIILEDR